MDNSSFLVFLLCFCYGYANITIHNLNVPQSIESNMVKEVTLDCDFDSGGDEGIEVKWYINGLTELIYQWIPKTYKPGQASSRFKDYVDVDYKASDDKDTMYRALRLVNIGPELSGNYSCKVSGDNSEATRTKSMIIYDPADAGLNVELNEDHSVVMCSSEGISPRPNMTLYIYDDNETNIIFQEDDETVEFDEDTDTYNVSSILNFDPRNLSGIIVYVCELSIPDTNYTLKETKSYDLAEEEVETQIVEDYLNLLDATSTTESPVDDGQAGSSSSIHIATSCLLPTSLMILISRCLRS